MKEIIVSNLFLNNVSYEDLIYTGTMDDLLQEMEETKTLLLIKHDKVNNQYLPVIASCNNIVSIELAEEALAETKKPSTMTDIIREAIERVGIPVEDNPNERPRLENAELSDLLSVVNKAQEDGEFVTIMHLPNGTSSTLLNDAAIASMMKEYFHEERMLFATDYVNYVEAAANKLFTFLDSIGYTLSIEQKDDAVTDMVEIIIDYLQEQTLQVVSLEVSDSSVTNMILKQYIDEYVCL